MSGTPLLVITGAAGRVGRLAVAALRDTYRLRLVDVHWPEDTLADGLERRTLDLHDLEAAREAMAGADLLLHLAAQPSPEIGVREAVEDVAMPTAQLAEAARSAGLRRLVLASSIHTMGLYEPRPEAPIRNRWPARPCCEYGAAKVLSENLLRLLTDRSAVSVVCLRLGLTGALPATSGMRYRWLGPADLGRLLQAALTADLTYGAYFGVSALGGELYDLSDAEEDLGYHPAEVCPAPTGEEQQGSPGRCRMR